MNLPRPAILFVAACLAGEAVFAEAANLSTNLMEATFKITNGDTQATGFLLSRPNEDSVHHRVLITAAHVLNEMKEDEATLVLRKPADKGAWQKQDFHFTIRRDGKPLWAAHPTQDVAAIALTLPADIPVPRLPVELLATDEMLKRYEVQPGEILRCVGFPHAGQFEPGESGFGLVRIGCLASYPLLPTGQTKTFLFDYNTFEGDSGAAVYLDDPRRGLTGPAHEHGVQMILGIVHGQHFIDEKFKTIYQSGMSRHRLGLAIVTHASAVRETIDLLKAEGH